MGYLGHRRVASQQLQWACADELGPTGKSAVRGIRRQQPACVTANRNLDSRCATSSNVCSTDDRSANSGFGSADANHASHHKPTVIGYTISCAVGEPLY